MEIKIEERPLASIDSGVLVLGAFQDEPMDNQFKAYEAFGEPFLAKMLKVSGEEDFKGRLDQQLILPTYGEVKVNKVIVQGLGPRAKWSVAQARKVSANIARRALGNKKLEHICFALPESGTAKFVQGIVEGVQLGTYTFTKYKSKQEEKKKSAIKKISFYGADADGFDKAFERGMAIGEAVCFARNLIAEPASFLTPTQLALEAKAAATDAGLAVEILDREQIEKLNMGCLLGVARGAKEPPQLIVIRYKHKDAKRTVALVGKGITFDSGGLSLKNAQNMEHMKYDMSGAAAVIAASIAIGRLKPKVNLLVVVAATENMPGGQAMHPGDVLVAMNGKTIEVNNTDAEGRLILADAIHYALGQGADEIIDIATLTGACVTALGRVAAGIMGTGQELIDTLIGQADETGEKLWQLPLFDEYKEGLKSDIADLKNAGSRGEAGTSSAAMFLKEFVDSRPWAHLDIAGPGWLDKEKDELNKGGTAFGVRTLCYYLLK